MFWVPRGWVPWYVEFMVAFPRAPRGSVSVQVWWAACAAAVVLGAEAVAGVWGMVMGEGGRGKEEKERKERMGMGTGMGEKVEEKEL